MNEPEVQIERLADYSAADAAGLGRLMPFLSERLSGDPVDEQLLQDIINSPYHDQLIARLEGRIVGAATLNLLLGPAVGRAGYLEDFVTDPEVRGRGVADKIWQEMLGWCRERGVSLEFTSHPKRVAAHRFYARQGAEIRETTVFHVPLPATEAEH